jgi:hypothetical protein
MNVNWISVSRDEVDRLISLPYTTDPRMDELGRPYALAVYVLDDDRVLIATTFDGALFGSRDDAMAALEERSAATRPNPGSHILFGFDSIGEDFPDHVDALIDQLCDRLHTNRSFLDLSFESMKRLDALAKAFYGAEIPLDIIPEAMAYIGGMLVRHYDCRWEMKLDEKHGRVWEPWLLLSTGRSVQIFHRLYDSITEENDLGAEFVSMTVVWVDSSKRPIDSPS